jgi:hypothetical protein
VTLGKLVVVNSTRPNTCKREDNKFTCVQPFEVVGCEFNRDELTITISKTRKCGFQYKCPARVVFINKNKDGVWRVSES